MDADKTNFGYIKSKLLKERQMRFLIRTNKDKTSPIQH